MSKRPAKKVDPIDALVSADEDQMNEMFSGLSEALTGAVSAHIKGLREFRDAGFAARADAAGVEALFDRAVSGFEHLLDAASGFIAAMDNNQPLPVPALRAATTEATAALGRLGADFDKFLEERPSLLAHRQRDAARLSAVSRALENSAGQS